MCHKPDFQKQEIPGQETKRKLSHSPMDSDENRMERKIRYDSKMLEETQA